MPEIDLKSTRTRLSAEEQILSARLLEVRQQIHAVDTLMGLELLNPAIADLVAGAAGLDIEQSKKGRANYRQLILATLSATQHPASAREIIDAIRAAHPEIDTGAKVDSTISAALSKMVSRKELHRIEGERGDRLRWKLTPTGRQAALPHSRHKEADSSAGAGAH